MLITDTVFPFAVLKVVDLALIPLRPGLSAFWPLFAFTEFAFPVPVLLNILCIFPNRLAKGLEASALSVWARSNRGRVCDFLSSLASPRTW